MKIFNKVKSLNIFILIVLFLLGFSGFYFLYHRSRSQANIFTIVSFRTGTVESIANWLDEAIKIGDKEISSLGVVNAEVIDKESYESGSNSRKGYLLLKINTVKDRSGVYLYKNKPLLVGTNISLNLQSALVGGVVTFMGSEMPKYEYKKIIVSGHDMSVESETAQNLQIDSEVKNNKGQVIAKVQNKQIKKENPIGLLYDPRSGLFEGTGTTRVDVILEVEMTVKKINDRYFFMETQKVKPDEFVFLPLKEVSLNLLVTSVKELK